MTDAKDSLKLLGEKTSIEMLQMPQERQKLLLKSLCNIDQKCENKQLHWRKILSKNNDTEAIFTPCVFKTILPIAKNEPLKESQPLCWLRVSGFKVCWCNRRLKTRFKTGKRWFFYFSDIWVLSKVLSQIWN